jgi:hypothetical protein
VIESLEHKAEEKGENKPLSRKLTAHVKAAG